MKNLSVVFALALLLITASAATAASTTSPANAQILTAISITNDLSLEFGQIAASGTAGSVSVSAAGLRSKTGGVTLASGGTAARAASFSVGGESGATYAVTLPSTDVTITDAGTDTMTVNTFVSASLNSGTLTGGADTLTVGAKLTVGVNQAAGSYTGTFSVAVDYN